MTAVDNTDIVHYRYLQTLPDCKWTKIHPCSDKKDDFIVGLESSEPIRVDTFLKKWIGTVLFGEIFDSLLKKYRSHTTFPDIRFCYSFFNLRYVLT